MIPWTNILTGVYSFRLENWRFEEWGDQVTVVSCDMRDWAAPEKADIIVSELLGSFGDNELSPECLDGAQHFLKGTSVWLKWTVLFVLKKKKKKKKRIDYKCRHCSCRVIECRVHPLLYASWNIATKHLSSVITFYASFHLKSLSLSPFSSSCHVTLRWRSEHPLFLHVLPGSPVLLKALQRSKGVPGTWQGPRVPFRDALRSPPP